MIFDSRRSLETMVAFKEWGNRNTKPRNLRLDKTGELLERGQTWPSKNVVNPQTNYQLKKFQG